MRLTLAVPGPDQGVAYVLVVRRILERRVLGVPDALMADALEALVKELVDTRPFKERTYPQALGLPFTPPPARPSAPRARRGQKNRS